MRLFTIALVTLTMGSLAKADPSPSLKSQYAALEAMNPTLVDQAGKELQHVQKIHQDIKNFLKISGESEGIVVSENGPDDTITLSEVIYLKRSNQVCKTTITTSGKGNVQNGREYLQIREYDCITSDGRRFVFKQ